jgi:hypothetical protein
LLDESKKAKVHVQHIAWGDVRKTVKDLLEQPAEVQREMVKYIKFTD